MPFKIIAGCVLQKPLEWDLQLGSRQNPVIFDALSLSRFAVIV